MTQHLSFCRACHNACPVVVDVEDGRVVHVTGDRENAMYEGYTCVKGRAQPALINHPGRLLHSQKRLPDGSLTPIPMDEVIEEIAAKLSDIIDRYGPESVAAYSGTFIIADPALLPFLESFMRAIESPMVFGPNTIDKPGRNVASALHGSWMAPAQGYHEPDVALLLGLNPFQSYYGVACGNPAKWLGERMDAGMQLIVVDPRKTDIAKRATLHLQPVPGEDAAILAAIINVIIQEELFDRDFVAENAEGFDVLAAAVAPFTPAVVAERADVKADDLVRAAEMFATPARGYCVSGVGPSFSASSTLVHYMLLNLETVCGHWMREGERVARAVTLMRPLSYKAQAAPPRAALGVGRQMRVHGLSETVAGLPTGVLADEILLEGEGKVRALFSCGGNPVGAWPDQLKTIEAMKDLDLLVQFDPWIGSTAAIADYVIAPTMAYEVAGATLLTDMVIATHYYGPSEAYADYTPAVVDPPEGSDVIPEWLFFYRLAQRMGLQLELRPLFPADSTPLDMTVTPTVDEILEILTRDSRVPLDEVKRHVHGDTFPDPPTFVAPKDPGWTGRLDLANEMMLADLAAVLATPGQAESQRSNGHEDDAFPFRLITRRMQHTYNSSYNFPETNRGRGYNPAFMHPDDLAELGVESGAAVEIRSRRASMPGVVVADATLRPGLISMSHGFGAAPDRDGEFREIGSPTGRLLDNTDFADPYVGMPRIGNIPVCVTPL